MDSNIKRVVLDTYGYCRNEDFSGWDPYDGLNSRLFSASPLNRSYLARLFWIQGFKHSPVNFRRLMLVDKGHNPKALGLMLSALGNLVGSPVVTAGSELDAELLADIRRVADLLLELRSPGYEEYCWGYNFAWQSRAFYLPKWTPTVVATSFAVDGLLVAYRLTGDQRYLDATVSATRFATRHLNRIKTPTGEGFSYSPLDNRLVYNATLLGSRYLAAVSAVTQDKSLLEVAKSSIESTRESFNDEGYFEYAREPTARWRDNFHTGFNLESMARYRAISGDADYDEVIANGTSYWLNNFFIEDGTCKYYDNSVYPLDIHCSAQVFPTLFHLGLMDSQEDLARKVTDHMVSRFYLGQGEFRFQIKKHFPINIRYFRWGTAWAFYGLSFFVKMYGDKLAKAT